MSEKIEMATISSRGQVCIPNEMRKEMGLEDGSKVLFVLADDTLLIKRVNMRTFAEITKPLKEAHKKIKESEVVDLVHKVRREKNKK